MPKNQKSPCHGCWNEHGSKEKCCVNCEKLQEIQGAYLWGRDSHNGTGISDLCDDQRLCVRYDQPMMG